MRAYARGYGYASHSDDKATVLFLFVASAVVPVYFISLKAKIPFGANRPGDWTVKSVFFATRY